MCLCFGQLLRGGCDLSLRLLFGLLCLNQRSRSIHRRFTLGSGLRCRLPWDIVCLVVQLCDLLLQQGLGKGDEADLFTADNRLAFR